MGYSSTGVSARWDMAGASSLLLKRLLPAIAFLGLIALHANAQTFRGAINGTVTDPADAAVVGAQVKALETATGIEHSTVSTSEGQFSFQDLPLGVYKVTVTATGFPAYTVDKIEVSAGKIFTLEVKLKLQTQATTVEIAADALVLDTTTATQSTTMTSDVVQDVPLNGRDFTQLVAVSPGYGGYSVGGYGSLNGTRPNQINWQIDGVDNNDFWHNIPAVNQGGVSGIAGTVFPVDAVEEFSAQTQSGAEAGRNAGGTVNLAIKSGTNAFHGSVYYYNRNEAFGEPSPFFIPSETVPKAPPLRNENYGFSLGGPIIKNKTFFFLSYEKQQYIIGLSGLATEPSDAYVNEALGVLSDYEVAPSTLSQNLIGPNGFWPRNVIGGLPASPKNFFSPVASTGYSYNGVVKIDHNFNEKNHIYARAFLGQGSQTAPLGGSPALGTASSNLKDYFEVAPLHVYNYSVVWNSVITPQLTNQVLTGVNYFNQTFTDFNNSFNTQAMGLFLSPDATIGDAPIPGAPNIAIAGFEQVGLTPPQGRNDVTWHLTDILSYTSGAHQLRFGGEFRQGRVNSFYHRRGTGKFVFDGTEGPWANDPDIASEVKALADFMAGEVSGCLDKVTLEPKEGACGSTIAVGNPERYVRVNAFSLFAGDSWRATRRLSIDFGMRYEYFGPMHSTSADTANFVPGKGLLIAGQSGGLSSLYQSDTNNFAPRFGFAYQVNQKGDLVLRGGIGVFYDQINMNPFLDFRPPITAAGGIQGNPIGPAPVSTFGAPLCPTNPNGSYNWQAVQGNVCPDGETVNPAGSVFPGVITCTDANCSNVSGLNLFSVNQNFVAPYFYNYSLQVEKSLGNAAVFQIGYVGSEGRKSNIVSNINQDGDFPNYGSILQLNSSGTSNYNALQTTFRLRSWHGLTAQVGYTWGHSLDEVSEYRGVILDDAFNRKYDYGNSDYDTRQLFTASIIYNIPRLRVTGWKDMLVNGWQVSSLMNFHKGQPYDELRSGMDVTCDPFKGVNHKFSAAQGGTLWVNTSCFTPATGGSLGIARNTYPGPGFSDVDFSIFKNFQFTERFRLQLRAEYYNLFNRVNLASGPGSVDFSSNGLVSDTIGDWNGAPGIGPGEARNLQLVIKLIF